jgi:hypothetical protein
LLDLVAVFLRPSIFHNPGCGMPILVIEQRFYHQRFSIDFRKPSVSRERTVYVEAFNKNDAPAVAALFTEDALQVRPEEWSPVGRP